MEPVRGFLNTRTGMSLLGWGLLFVSIGGWGEASGYVAARKLRAGRALFAGTVPVRMESILDTLKVILFVGFFVYVLAGIAVIAGGDVFGSAGSTLRF